MSNFSRRSLLQGAAAAGMLSLLPQTSFAAKEIATLEVDFADVRGKIKPLHGVNGGPLCDGETVDLTKQWKEACIPFARLHDCNWPRPDVVDFHAIFPNEDADPTKPESYTFAKTDDYLEGVLKSGVQIVYRLGESIEHSKTKFHAHPPRDFKRWAEACCGIIRHYNAGWANGFEHNIKYWEIWNEPENKPAMWSGSDEQYFDLYCTAAKILKQEFPGIKIGGPAIGAVGDISLGHFRRNAYCDKFLAHVKRENAPLDFFSWHTYTNDPTVFGQKAKSIRTWLDENGFAETEQHLNEWNYLPGNSWAGLAKEFQGLRREAYYNDMASIDAAAFLAHVLCDLQDSSIDVANLFAGDNGPFGLFTQHGAPKKTYFVFRAFQMLCETPRRLALTGTARTLAAVAGVSEDSKSATVLISITPVDGERQIRLEFKNLPAGKWRATGHLLDGKSNLTAEPLEITKDDPTVYLGAPNVAVVAVRLVAE